MVQAGIEAAAMPVEEDSFDDDIDDDDLEPDAKIVH
jgi:hypothetical protein